MSKQSGEPEPRRFWFPIFPLCGFFLVVVAIFFFTLSAFNPHVAINPEEWESKKPKISKPVELMMRLFGTKKKEKTNEK